MTGLVFDTVALMRLRRAMLRGQVGALELPFQPVTTPLAMAELGTDVPRPVDWVQVRAPKRSLGVTDLAMLSRTLDAAAISVLALAHELEGTAVIEDKATRLEAERIGIPLGDLAGALGQALRDA